MSFYCTCLRDSITRPPPPYTALSSVVPRRRQVLSDALIRHFKSQDFGKQIIPELIREGLKVGALTEAAHFIVRYTALLSLCPSVCYSFC